MTRVVNLENRKEEEDMSEVIKNNSGETKSTTRIWFTSDTHFGSKRHLDLCCRPFKSVEEMDNAMIYHWNNLVDDNDIVYHLGDFGDIEVAKNLKGHKLILPGDYESDDDIKKLEEYGFKEVGHLHRLDTPGGKYQIRLTHKPSDFKEKAIREPIPGDPYYEEMIEKYMNEEPAFCLFGHIHMTQLVKQNGLNVGVDCHHFRPISLERVQFFIEAIRQHYDGEVFSTYCGKRSPLEEDMHQYAMNINVLKELVDDIYDGLPSGVKQNVKE